MSARGYGVKCFRCRATMERVTETRAVCPECGTRTARFPVTYADKLWLKLRGKWLVED